MGTQKNLCDLVRLEFGENSGLCETEILIGKNKITIFNIECLIDKKLLSSGIFLPLKNYVKNANNGIDLNEIKMKVLAISSIESVSEKDEVVNGILSGKVAIIYKEDALLCPVFGAEQRGIEEPPNQRVTKGPREGFVESLNSNLGLIRKRLKTTNLKVVEYEIGKQSKTKISIVYLNGIAKEDVIEKIKQKISKINIDAIIDSYYIESFLEGEKFKFFRRVGNTEKPDIFCAKILEGRIGILVDGSPVALTAPFVIFEDLQSAEDYYNIPLIATFSRLIRIFGLVFALLIPGMYVALQTYNYRLLPINFLIALLSSIEGLSVPPLVEILCVLFMFETIMEASIRMPSALGMALSIIGALALGNTAVDAGIISPPSIVVVAVSSVALYIIPDQIAEARILRAFFTAIGGIAGLYGIFVSFVIMTTYLCSITSFGVPYMAPYVPNVKSDKKDAFIKHSIQDMKLRPQFLAGKNKKRQGSK
ncbi:MAG: spore germination protein [Clostridia bacterium]|nr:spore germination protein [Clostridia bacterium]